MSTYLEIGGSAVKPPQEFTVGIQNIDGNSGRNAAGKMVRDVIAQKIKLECKWGPLSDAEISNLLQKVDDDFFTVTYPDPKIGGLSTKRFYVGDRTAPSYSWHEKFASHKWQGLSMNFVEE